MSRVKKTSNSSAPKKASRAKQSPLPQPEVHPDTISANTVSAKTTAEERIRLRAYDLFVQRGGFWGTPDRDWFQAEAEMRGHHVA